MDVKYKSSSFITYIQYIITPIIIGLYFYEVYHYITYGIFTEDFSMFIMPILFWACIGLVICILKLRYVKVTENNILIKKLNSEEIIEYKDIEWINQNIIGSGWYIILIKYKDIKINKSKIILILPEFYTEECSRYFMNTFKELDMTKYIRNQIIKNNQNYIVSEEPSRWMILKLIILSLIPFLLFTFILKISL